MDNVSYSFSERASPSPIPSIGSLLGASAAMQEVFRLIERVGPTEASVLLTGESGSGKELAAQSIHECSPRRAKPFIAINCGAIPPGLIEAELFGYEKGSFTGAVRAHAGVFERANGGTLLLDEITEMPAEMQTRLLRVLETRKFYRVGANIEYTCDVRVIAATNRCPLQAVQSGQLREDLLYRVAAQPRSGRRASRRPFPRRTQPSGLDPEAPVGAGAYHAQAALVAGQRARVEKLHRARLHSRRYYTRVGPAHPERSRAQRRPCRPNG